MSRISWRRQPVRTASPKVITQTVAFDDFNRADGPLGANWNLINGTLAVVSNAMQSSTSVAQAGWHVDFLSDGIGVETVVQSADPYYEFGIRLRNGAGRLATLFRDDASHGADYELQGLNSSISLPHAAPNIGDALRIEVRGTEMYAYLNGVKILTLTGQPILKGILFGQDVTNSQPFIITSKTGVRIDNFKVTEQQTVIL